MRCNRYLYIYLSLLIRVRFIGVIRPKPIGGAGAIVKPGKILFIAVNSIYHLKSRKVSQILQSKIPILPSQVHPHAYEYEGICIKKT